MPSSLNHLNGFTNVSSALKQGDRARFRSVRNPEVLIVHIVDGSVDPNQYLVCESKQCSGMRQSSRGRNVNGADPLELGNCGIRHPQRSIRPRNERLVACRGEFTYFWSLQFGVDVHQYLLRHARPGQQAPR